MLFKLSNLNSNLELTLGYLNRALNNTAQVWREDDQKMGGGGGDGDAGGGKTK